MQELENEMILCSNCRSKTIPKTEGIHICNKCNQRHKIESLKQNNKDYLIVRKIKIIR